MPWPATARDALVRLLASGPGLLPVWETLDEIDGIETFLPEWEQIRLLPHASAIHRFTVDRHVVETCAAAGALIRSVRRPDLLLVAAMLHDIGKGSLHDHSVAGEPLARKIVARMGFTDLDAEVVASLVRWHLLLANLATTRDPDDPATTAELLTHVPDAASLELLRALTEADARATSPPAWTTLAGLAHRPARAPGSDRPGRRDRPLALTAALPSPTSYAVTRGGLGRRHAARGRRDRHRHRRRPGGAAGRCRGWAGRPACAGARGAGWSQVDGEGEWRLSSWEVPDAYLDGPPYGSGSAGSRRGPSGCPTARAPRRRAPPHRGGPPRRLAASLVLEIRTSDRLGVVHLVLTTLAGLGLTVASAHVSTIGPQAVDVFYVQEDGGVRPTELRAAAAAHAVCMASAAERRRGGPTGCWPLGLVVVRL